MILVHAAALAQLRAEITPLKATVEEVAQRLGRHSHHASQPPSADPPPPPVGVGPAGSLATRGTRGRWSRWKRLRW
jgi:hypothetical protein